MVVIATARTSQFLGGVVYDVHVCFVGRQNKKAAPSKGQAWRLNNPPCNSPNYLFILHPIFERVHVCPPALRKLRTYDSHSQTMPDEHLPAPPPSRWRALIASPPLAKFQLVWRRLCEALLSSSSLARQTNPSLLSRVCLTYVGDIEIILP